MAQRTLTIVSDQRNPTGPAILEAATTANGEVVFWLGSRDGDHIEVAGLNSVRGRGKKITLMGRAIATIGGGLVAQEVLRDVEVRYNTATRTGTIKFEN